MKIIVPNYYENFKCIADQCRHNCCIGWEIDIDKETHCRYRSVSGPFGERLKNAIALEETPHFILGPDERCPFLNESNLCEIITEFGEGSLCQICRDHPRFRNEFTGHTEMGLGLCCEAAGRLILSQKEPAVLPPLPHSTSPDETAFFTLRTTLFSLIQDRSLSMEQRLSALLSHCRCTLPDLDCQNIYRSLERLDPDWDAYIDRLALSETIPTEWELPFEQLSVYFLYRHLPAGLEDGLFRERILFAVLSVRLIAALFATASNQTMETLIELARLYSSEIEYSDENIEYLLNKLTQG